MTMTYNVAIYSGLLDEAVLQEPKAYHGEAAVEEVIDLLGLLTDDDSAVITANSSDHGKG